MRFKKIYIEITNICNMNCSFCPPHNREKRFMSKNEFETILNKIKPYTKYIYLHVKGEPMLHPNFDELVKLAYDKGFFVNITTNGTLLQNHLEVTKYIRQINISLHATNKKEIIEIAKNINNSYVNFRIWNTNNSIINNDTIKILEECFNTNIGNLLEDTMDKKQHHSLKSETNFTIKDNFYASIQNEFKWPNLDNETATNGYCHALKDHIAILVDGTVVPCCLDNNGDIPLGNILTDNIETILNSQKTLNIINGFKERKCIENLCQKCDYKNRF